MEFKNLLLLALAPFLLLILFTLRPGGPEKSYELNKKVFPFLLPGKWKEKDYFVFWTRRLAWLWLSVFLLISFLIYKWG